MNFAIPGQRTGGTKSGRDYVSLLLQVCDAVREWFLYAQGFLLLFITQDFRCNVCRVALVAPAKVFS